MFNARYLSQNCNYKHESFIFTSFKCRQISKCNQETGTGILPIILEPTSQVSSVMNSPSFVNLRLKFHK